jgi:hypothetical protein
MEAHADDYEYINEESINELLKCKICRRPFILPTLTKCGPSKHTFCRLCIEKRIKDDPSCPTEIKKEKCGQLLKKEDLTPIIDGPLIDMLKELEVRCKRCSQSGIERVNFIDHISKACSKVNISCPSADIKCPWKGSRDELNQHLTTCIFNPLRDLITELREQMHGQQTQINEQQTQINKQQTQINEQQTQISRQQTQINGQQTQTDQLRSQINKQQTQIEQVTSQVNQLLQNQIKPLESKFVDAACLRFLTSTIDLASRGKRWILKIPNPWEYNGNPGSTVRILEIPGVKWESIECKKILNILGVHNPSFPFEIAFRLLIVSS